MELSNSLKLFWVLELNLSQERLSKRATCWLESESVENNKSKPNQIARYALIELCKRKLCFAFGFRY